MDDVEMENKGMDLLKINSKFAKYTAIVLFVLFSILIIILLYLGGSVIYLSYDLGI
jgi:hypothetical protein